MSVTYYGGSDGGGGSGAKIATVVIPGSTVAFGSTSPTELIAGQTGKAIVLYSAWYVYQPGTVPLYTYLGGPVTDVFLWVGTQNVNGQAVSSLNTNGGFLAGLQTQVYPPGIGASAAPSDVSGLPLSFCTADDIGISGPIQSAQANPGNTGTGYAVGDTGIILGFAGGSAEYVIDDVEPGGEVNAFTITNPGVDFAPDYVGDTFATTGGGSGLKILVLEVDFQPTNMGNLTVQVMYDFLDLA